MPQYNPTFCNKYGKFFSVKLTIDLICTNPKCNKKFTRPLDAHKRNKKDSKPYCSYKCAKNHIIPSNTLDIVGKTFGKLTCIKQLPKPTPKYKGRYYLFLCSCGNEHKANASSVNLGRVDCCNTCKNLKMAGDKNPNWCGYGEIPHSWWKRRIIKRAKDAKMINNISIEYGWELFLEQNKKCVYSGVELTFPTNGKYASGTASLDRIQSSLGYIKGNVQWVHKDINMMKQSLTDEEFIKWCHLIANNRPI